MGKVLENSLWQSAVVGDIIDAAKHLKGTKREPDGNGEVAKVLSVDELESNSS